MRIDSALARGLAREISKRRTTAQVDDPRTSAWTDRDVARRMTEAGHQMQHPAVIRARSGTRTVSAQEWLTFALVLSVAPLSLLDPGEPIEIGGDQRDIDDVAAWLNGVRPLEGVDSPATFYATAGSMRSPEQTPFAGVLRSLADHFDTAANGDERHRVLDRIARQALDAMQINRRLEQTTHQRKAQR